MATLRPRSRRALGEHLDDRRLARAADGQVADHHHQTAERLVAQDAMVR
jgi:hypothetical protein